MSDDKKFSKEQLQAITKAGLKVLQDERNVTSVGDMELIQALRAILVGIHNGNYLLAEVEPDPEQAAPE